MKKFFPHFLLVIYIVEFIVLYFNPTDRAVWWTENMTVFPIAFVLVILYLFKIRFSNIAYLMMSILIYMHTIGGHYTFALVPFDWFNDFFGFERNMYDRVAHATVGFYAYPIIEYFRPVRENNVYDLTHSNLKKIFNILKKILI